MLLKVNTVEPSTFITHDSDMEGGI